MESRALSWRNGRVWFGEAADQAIFVPIDHYVHILPAAPHSIGEKSRICLRLIFQSGHTSFGKLGCEFTPNDSGVLTIKVGVSHNQVEEMPNIGLPHEYAQVVFEKAVTLLTAENKLGSGDLTFDRAEYHVVDSNRYVFRLLTNVILHLLEPENKSANVDDINTYVADLRKREYKW